MAACKKTDRAQPRWITAWFIVDAGAPTLLGLRWE